MKFLDDRLEATICVVFELFVRTISMPRVATVESNGVQRRVWERVEMTVVYQDVIEY